MSNNMVLILKVLAFIVLAPVVGFFLEGFAGLFSDSVGKVIFATGYVLICWLILFFLYKKDVFLKV